MSETNKDLINIEVNPKAIIGTVELGGSKSIANRALIIQALCKEPFEIKKLSDSKDTKTLQQLLEGNQEILDTGHAGTCFRFMTAYLATKEGQQVLTGSDRMKERPIAPLVNALNHLGADINYLEKEGYPPLQINGVSKNWKNTVSIDGTMSSQFITALMLIAPTIPDGLTINIIGDLVSVPYVEMTLKMMKYFGVDSEWENQCITIPAQEYIAKDFLVEADWSSASYLYNLVALNEGSEVQIKGLFPNSLQGDSEIQKFATSLGVKSEWNENVLHLKHHPNHKEVFEYNFIRQPDLAQSIACICAGKGIKGLFNGLQTLFIKETNRVKALQDELIKVNVFMSKLPAKFNAGTDDDYYLIEGEYEHPNKPFETYKDHRMAMAFACFSTRSNIQIKDPTVVVKSFPTFWKVLEDLGFQISE